MKLMLYVAIYIRHSPLASVWKGALHSTSFVMPWVERYEYAIVLFIFYLFSLYSWLQNFTLKYQITVLGYIMIKMISIALSHTLELK